MTNTPQGFLTTNQPDLFFEDNAVGRMKKEVWDASAAQIDAHPSEFLVGLEVADADERPRWNPGDFFGEKFGRK